MPFEINITDTAFTLEFGIFFSIGTEALVYQEAIQQQVVLGPGDIAQAHTVGEWIDVAQLEEAVSVYRRIIERTCL